MTQAVASVYVHAPFCARRCFYCDFAVSVRRHAEAGPWADAIAGELQALRREGRAHLSSPLESLYLGGGTPSLLGAEAPRLLLEALEGEDGAGLIGPGTEFTAEANPESFTRAVAEGWRGAGVTRVSLGTQSFHEPVLRWMGRLHGAEGARAAVRRARDAGLDDVSIDLIFGLPDQVERRWRADLDAALALDVPHLSLYGLTAEPGTPLGRQVARGQIAMPDDERYREEYLTAHAVLTAAGYEHYEVSSFARPGHTSRHNGVYWSGAPYLGLGNGAHSFLPPVRRWNLREWPEYREVARQARLPVHEAERLTPAALRLERAWLGLRTRTGLDAAALSPRGQERVRRWVGGGLAEWCGSAGDADEPAGRRVVLTPAGWLELDRLAVEIEEELALPGDADG